MLDEVGIKLPNHKVRDIVQELTNKGETNRDFLAKSEFENVRRIIIKIKNDSPKKLINIIIPSCVKSLQKEMWLKHSEPASSMTSMLRKLRVSRKRLIYGCDQLEQWFQSVKL